MALSKEEFEAQLKEVYDNLTLEQFNYLLKQTSNKINNLVATDDLQLNYVTKTFSGMNEHEVLSANVFSTVSRYRKISFKQFKSLSWFSGIKWFVENKTEETEFKQF